MLGPWGIAISSAIAATTALYSASKAMIERGQSAANDAEAANAKLGGQLASRGVVDSAPITKHLQGLSENGVASLETLSSIFAKLIPTLNGDTEAALEWTERLADVEAATGVSAQSIAALIEQVQDQGTVDEKLLKRLQKQGIPIYRELAAVCGVSLDAVGDLAKAHQIGAGQMEEALKRATEMYKGTAAAISGTTEGARASMEAARAMAYQASADAYNDVLREHYAERQAEYDALGASEQWQQRQKIIGETIGTLDALFADLGDWLSDLGDGFLGFFADMVDALGGYRAEYKIAAREAGKGAENAYRTLDRAPAMNSETAKNAGNQITANLANARQELTRLQNRLEHAATIGNEESIIKAIDAQEKYIHALEQAENALKAQAAAAKYSEDMSKAQAEAQAALEARLKAAETARGIRQSSAIEGGNANGIAKSFGYSNAGELESEYERIMMQVMAGITPTEADLAKVQELQKAYKAIQAAREKEAEALQKELEGEQKKIDAALKAADAAEQERKAKEEAGAAMMRAAEESETYNKAFDHLASVQKQLDKTNLSTEQKNKILDKEIAKMIADTKEKSITARDESINVQGQTVSLKDFKFTDFDVQDKQLSELEEIRKAAFESYQLWATIGQKLPSPTRAL